MKDARVFQWKHRGWILFLFVLTYLYLFLRVLWRVGDEGSLVYGAQLITEGALPYRDFFEVMGPLSFYWLALFFKLLGTKWIVARGVLLLTGAVTTMLIYWMTRRLYRGPFDMFPAIYYLLISIPLWPATNHHWDSNLFALLSIGVFFTWQERGSSWYLIIAGIIAGLASGFLQQKGLFLCLAFLSLIVVNGILERKSIRSIMINAGLVSSGFLAVIVAIALFFQRAGALPDLVYATILWPLSRYHEVNITPYGYGLFELLYRFTWEPLLESLFPRIISQCISVLCIIPFLIIMVLPVLLIVVAAMGSLSDKDRLKVFSTFTLPYWGVGFALWFSEIHRFDFVHLIYGTPILLIVFFVTWVKTVEIKFLRSSGLVLITFCLVLLGTINASIASIAVNKQATRRGTVYNFKNDEALIYLQDRFASGDQIFVYPYYPMYYFLADIHNPTRYSILVYNINSENQFNEAIADLEGKRVKYVLWDTVVHGPNLKTWFPQYIHPPDNSLHLEQYLMEHYEVIAIKNNFRILQRRG